MKDLAIYLPNDLKNPVLQMYEFKGNVMKLLAKRNLLFPGVIVEADGKRQEVVRNHLYGKPGPLRVERGEIVECQRSDGGQLVPEGKFLGEHYGHHPFTLSEPKEIKEVEKIPDEGEI